MRMREIICTIYAFASVSTCNSGIKTLTIFFLALGFFTDTTLSSFTRSFTFYFSFCLLVNIFLCIGATRASAFLSTSNSRWETLTVSFQAVCFFAGTASFLLLNIRCLNYGIFHIIDFQSERIFFLLWCLLLLYFVQASQWMVRHILYGLYEK